MFYLIQFVKILWKSPLKGSLLVILSLLFVVPAVQKSLIEEKVLASLSEMIKRPYFHALIPSKENYHRISRKIANLPGVYGVKILPREEVFKQTDKILKDYQISMEDGMVDNEFVGVKVVFKRDLGERSQNLIREYMVRLVGKEKATLGAISMNDERSRNKMKQLVFLKNWGSLAVLLLVALLWLASFAGLGKNINENSYLIEQFQRRRGVAMKISAVGTMILLMSALLVAFSFGEPEIFNIVYVGILFLTGLGLKFRKFIWID